MVDDDASRWLQRFERFIQVHDRLRAACAQELYSDLELAGLVQTFEFTFELAWKTLHDLLAYRGIDVDNPRDTLKAAFQFEMLGPDVDTWLAALRNRNRLAHTYDHQGAVDAEQLIKAEYAPMLDRLRTVLSLRATP